MKRADVEFLFATLQRANPQPASELLYSSTFELLAAVLLSAQATDVGVNRATRRLFALAPTPQAMLALGEDALCDHIRSIGLYRTKAKHLLQTCRILVERHGGEVPRDRDALQALPGVGRKTANVVLNVAFGEPTMAVDTHVFRVANRTGLAPGSTTEAVEDGLLAVVPDPFRVEAHHWLILHGRYVCTSRLPDCRACAISSVCAAFAASGGAETLRA
ncbi:MAG TPA: endonuclease III [Burkholderiaceae bacterium]|nr:endonuclease III [Burkholderiaceae bacterium]